MTTQQIAEMITFLLMTLLIGVYGYPRIRDVARRRQDMISAALTEAEQQQRTAADQLAQAQSQLDAAQAQAEAIMERAHREADELLGSGRERATAEAQAIILQARSQIAAERDQAIQHLRDAVAVSVVAAAGDVLAEALTPAGHQHLIDVTLSRLSSVQQDSN